MYTFDTATAITAVLDIPAGRIQVVAADRTDTTVEVRPANPAKGRDAKAAEQITVDYADGVLRIAAAPPANRVLGHSGSVEVTIQVPAGSSVRAKAAAAEFRGVGRLGDVTVDGAYGKDDAVKIDEAASVRLTAHAGDVKVGHLGGPAEISTTKGDITITEAQRGAVVLRTQAGDITVEAAHGANATLDAGTAFGRIHNSLKNTESTPDLTIHATTAHGDITARSL